MKTEDIIRGLDNIDQDLRIYEHVARTFAELRKPDSTKLRLPRYSVDPVEARASIERAIARARVELQYFVPCSVCGRMRFDHPMRHVYVSPPETPTIDQLKSIALANQTKEDKP